MNNLQIYERLIKNIDKNDLFKKLKITYYLGFIIFAILGIFIYLKGINEFLGIIVILFWAFLLFVDILINIFLSKILVDYLGLEDESEDKLEDENT